VIFFFLLLFAVETSRPVRAGDNAIFTSDAPSEILHDDTVFTAIRCFGWADGHARGMITMHAGHGNELGVRLGIFTVGHGNDLIPEDIPSQPLLIR
jgi:hypothetical protein